MSYERFPTTIPMYNDSFHHETNENFASTSASASAPSPNPITQHRHRKKSSATAYGYGGYGYSSYSNSAPRRRVSPVRTNPPIIPRFMRRIGSLLLRTLQAALRKTNPNSRRINLRRIKDPTSSLPKIIVALLLLAFCALLYLLLRIYEPHIELAFYSRKFAREEIVPVKPLAGCFNRPSRRYNVTESLYSPRLTDVHAGLEMRFGLDCYEFAGTVRSPARPKSPHLPRTQFHTYWRFDLVPFGPRQEYMLKSFFATQNLATSQLVLWSNGDLSGNTILKEYLHKYGDAFAVREVNVTLLAIGTELDPDNSAQQKLFAPAYSLSDSKAWLDGDLIRLLLLWNYGGVWVDMDFLLTRDLEPLLEHEFVTQWDCYDKKYTPLNGALMRFHVHSPYLCEAFHIMATDSPPRPHSTDWGSTLYLKLYRRLMRAGVKPFKVLPWCFTDGRSCRLDNRLPDPFKEDHKAGIKWWEDQPLIASDPSNQWWTFWRTSNTKVKNIATPPADDVSSVEYTGDPPALARALSQVFGIHLHNQWEKSYPKDGWVERLLLRRYERILVGAESDKGPEESDQERIWRRRSDGKVEES
ncbi:hypothetical protein BDP27DRAFT_1329793 [Rhodocollybia butyracea]|uniref:Glycosyltransferase family 32 protein n=1 Tax=Rhodocollybia butyracea TaxID=206335 RepID=A0A9P5U5L2_9AGAR|nr:hypothetical protein BDP27DRAFT_1329793 [Rhodocollybia butyracea]